MSKFARKPPPSDFALIEPTLNELEQELRVGTAERLQGNKGSSATWPVVQVSNQRTRYVHDMYYKYHRISSETFEYCRKYKIIDAALSDKWLEPGYERLCCLAAIQTTNHTFGTVAVCRLPNAREKVGKVENPYSGCHGCASGKGGEKNIFGNKYGVNLADEQIERESGEPPSGEGERNREGDEREEEERERKRMKKEKKKKKEKKEKKKKHKSEKQKREGEGEEEEQLGRKSDESHKDERKKKNKRDHDSESSSSSSSGEEDDNSGEGKRLRLEREDDVSKPSENNMQ